MKVSSRIGGALSVLVVGALVGVPTACAQPSGFPDLSQFTEVGAGSPVFTTTGIGTNDARFSTPDGLRCAVDNGTVSCQSYGLGVMPKFPTNARHIGTTTTCPSENVLSDDTGSEFAYGQNCDANSGLVLLQSGQKVTIGKAVCAVGDNRLTACTNGTHGFVIQPAGTWTF